MNSFSYLSNDCNGVAARPIPEHLPLTDEMFHESVAKWPDNIALVCAHQAANLYGIPSVANSNIQRVEDAQAEERRPYLRWTFQNLESGVDRLKTGLRRLGVRPGMAVATFMPNCAEYVLTWWAARGMGLVMAPLNPRNLSNKEEVASMLDTIMKGTGDQPAILVVFDQELLESEPLKSAHFFAKIVVSTEGRQPQSDGVLFGDLMSTHESNGDANACRKDEQPTDDEILFTSGSTSRPKGIKIKYPILSLGMYDFANTPGCNPQPGDLWLALTPNNHGMGRGTLTSSMCFGGGTVYSGFYFNVEEAAEMLLTERCTHAALVPALIRLLSDAVSPRLRKTARDRSLLKTIYLSGAPPTRADLQECIDILGIESVSSVYGMTEGAEASSPAHSDLTKLLNDEGMLTVGIPRSRGASLKICAPDATGPDRPPLPLGTPGEIHYTGPGRLPRPTIYMGKPDTEDFCYTDREERRWFITGDRGLIDEGKQLYLIGRSKDMIVRGGENIAPAAIESCLAENSNLGHLSIQIVGAPDAIAGEVPVAVVATSAEELKHFAKEIHQTIVKNMGPIYVPSQILPLEALGIKDWPRTLTGKIRKVEIAELVNKLFQETEDSDTEVEAMSRREQLASEVLKIWARSVGLEETSLSTNQPISEFADSLTVARVLRRIKRSINGCSSLSAQDMNRADTIEDQINLIMSIASVNGNTRENGVVKGDSTLLPPTAERRGPPGVDEMVHLTEQPSLLDPTKQLVLEAITKYGFGWDNVEDIYPAQPCVVEISRDSMNRRAKCHIVDLMTREKDPERVKKAVQTMLCYHHILSSFLVCDKDGLFGLGPELALHVTLRHDQKLLDHVVELAGNLKTVEELQRLAINDPRPDQVLLPGILFRVLIYTVEETGTVGLIYITNHVVLDASTIWMFQEDLDSILSGQPLQPHADFKLWSDMFYSFRSSPQARSAINWHAKYLSGIENHLEKGLWRPVQQPGRDYVTGVHYSFQVPHIGALRRKYPELSAPVIIKSALVLLNVWHTGHTHALFANIEDGRTKWPFMPPVPKGHEYSGLFGDGQDVAGPTMQIVANLVEVRPLETVVDFLFRMQDDQENLTKYAHAPWVDIERIMGVERGTIKRAPGFGAQAQAEKTEEPFENLRVLAAVTRWPVGINMRMGLGGVNNDIVVMHFVGDALDLEQKVHIAKCVEKLTVWLTQPEQWEAPVGGFKDVITLASEPMNPESIEGMTRNQGLSCLLPRKKE